MSTQPIDYAALAKQAGAISSQPAGGGVDYAALAKQSGAISSVPAQPADPQAMAQSMQQPLTSVLDQIKAGLKAAPSNLLKGIGEGALQTVGTVSSGLNKLPFVGETLAPKQGISALKQIATPENTTQRIGAAAEQVGEMYATGGPLRAGAESLAARLPFLGKLLAPAARIGAEAVNTGASAALHDQPVGQAAAMGAGGAGIGEAAKYLAQPLAEAAMGVTKAARRYGKTPGATILAETTGTSPSAIAEQAQSKANELVQQLDAAAARSGRTASLQPALNTLDDALDKAGNSPTMIRNIRALRAQLTVDNLTKQPIPTQVTPSQLLALKRGVGMEIKSWSGEQAGAAAGLKQSVYHAMDSELDNVVPESQGLNTRIMNLIQVANSAESTSRNASVAQGVLHRVGAHTGALAGALGGGSLGYREGGLPGAAAGAVGGAVLPELVASPRVGMRAARLLNSGILPLAAGRSAAAVSGQGQPQPDDEFWNDAAAEYRKRHGKL